MGHEEAILDRVGPMGRRWQFSALMDHSVVTVMMLGRVEETHIFMVWVISWYFLYSIKPPFKSVNLAAPFAGFTCHRSS